jgi:CheY-like chemotaxis protein
VIRPEKLPPNHEKVFDAAALLEMTQANPAGRSSLLGVIGNVVERAPDQLREARQAWIEGRIEESARSLHTMRGTIGTLGAARFAAAARELESAIRAQQVGRVSGLFDAAGQELAETVAAAAALLLKEAVAKAESGGGQGSLAGGPAGANPVAGQERSLPPWYSSMRAEIRNILDDVRQLLDDVKDLSREQLFAEAVATLPSCLVVEDDELIAHVLVHLLTREGYRVQRCADGRAAQQVIELATEPPGLILLDVMLPYVDGYELIRIIRAQKLWTAVPIIMLTAKQQEHDIVRALDAGATDYVVKPFQPNELMARLRRILRVKGK